MKAIVTGGCGFIGSHMVEFLAQEGHQVTVIDDCSAPQNNEFYKFDNVNYVSDSIINKSTHKLYADADYVFHFAARSRIQPSLSDPRHTFENNVLGTQSVLQAARKYNIKKVVYSGSSSVYADIEPPHKESTVTNCLNPYSLSKLQGEQLCKMYSQLWGLSTIILRYFNVYGPREPLKGQYAPVVGIFKRQRELNEKLTIVGDGHQRRDFTYVKDVVRANWQAAETKIHHDLFNIGTGINYSVNDVAAMVTGETTFIPPRPTEARETLADIAKARKDLWWVPEYSLPDMINSY